jgi:hypothetical protein
VSCVSSGSTSGIGAAISSLALCNVGLAARAGEQPIVPDAMKPFGSTGSPSARPCWARDGGGVSLAPDHRGSREKVKQCATTLLAQNAVQPELGRAHHRATRAGSSSSSPRREAVEDFHLRAIEHARHTTNPLLPFRFRVQ